MSDNDSRILSESEINELLDTVKQGKNEGIITITDEKGKINGDDKKDKEKEMIICCENKK